MKRQRSLRKPEMLIINICRDASELMQAESEGTYSGGYTHDSRHDAVAKMLCYAQDAADVLLTKEQRQELKLSYL